MYNIVNIYEPVPELILSNGLSMQNIHSLYGLHAPGLPYLCTMILPYCPVALAGFYKLLYYE